MNTDVILCGDALEMIKTLPDQSVDSVITDLPYSSGARREAGKRLRSARRGIANEEWFDNDHMTTGGFVWFMRTLAWELRRVVRSGGHNEMIVHCTNGKGVQPQRRDVGNVLSYKAIKNGIHPTQKPVSLLRALISVVVPREGIILIHFWVLGQRP